MQANTIIVIPNVLGIPRSCSIPFNTVSIITTPSNRSTVMEKSNSEKITVSMPVYSKSTSRSGVMHRIAFNTFGLKTSVLLILSPTIANITAMFTTKATIYRPQTLKRLLREGEFERRYTNKTPIAGPKERAMKYHLELPSYFAR